MRVVFLTGILLSAALAAAHAAAPAAGVSADPAPPPPPAVGTSPAEPEITIIQSDNETIEEYRVNGQLYMIKVTPSKGPSYYLVDSDGDGLLESRRNDLAPEMLTPQWTLFRWK